METSFYNSVLYQENHDYLPANENNRFLFFSFNPDENISTNFFEQNQEDNNLEHNINSIFFPPVQETSSPEEEEEELNKVAHLFIEKLSKGLFLLLKPRFSDFLNELKGKKKTKEKIFHISKKGRRHKGVRKSSRSRHGNLSSDNNKRKIKVRFINLIYSFIEKSFLNCKRNKRGQIINVLRKIDNKIWINVGKLSNNSWLNITVKDLFSVKIRNKYKKNPDKFYNVKKIREIIKENKETKVISILNKKVQELFEIYLGEKVDNEGFYDDFTLLEDEFKRDVYKNENQEFFDIYRKNAKSILFQAKEKKESKKGKNKKSQDEKTEMEIDG